MKPTTLRTVLESVLRSSLGPAVALAGCGPGLPADPAAYELAICADGVPSLQGLRPGAAVDFAELRQIFGPETGGTQRALSSFGAACATARDQAACKAQLAALLSTTGFFQRCVDACVAYYAATTQGDQVKSVNTPADWRALLGGIDNAQEAALVAFGQGYNVSCTDKARGGVRPIAGGFEVIATKGIACGAGSDVTRYVLAVSSDGSLREVSSEIIERGNPTCAIGRRPAGLRDRRRRGLPQGRALGRHFAVAAHLEAASVAAFAVLGAELTAHGAPQALREQAAAGVLEEVRHAQLTARLARRFGGRPLRPVVAPRPLRPQEELALENAVEGCVRETFGALVAALQAGRAADGEIAAALREIAADELRHAALAWQVEGWAQRRLGRAARSALQAARRRAVAALREELGAEPAREVAAQAGAPTAAEALALCEGMDQALWGAA